MCSRHAFVAVAALVLAACLGATSGESNFEEAVRLLNQSRASVESLEASLVTLQGRLSAAEQVVVSTAEETSLARQGLLRLEAVKDRPVLEQHGADLNATLESELLKLRLATSQADDLSNASAQVALRAEQLVGNGEIKSRHGICLDAAERGVNGGKVRMWACLRGVKNQQWYFNAQTGLIRNLHGICLAAPEASSKVLMWTCDPGLGSQRWSYESSTGLLRSGRGDSACLGTLQPTLKGGDLSVSTCDPSLEGQQWSLVAGSSGTMQRVEALNKQIWDAADPRSPKSTDAAERQLGQVEAVMSEFEGSLAGRVRTVLAKRLRHGANGMRHALRHLAAKASDETQSEDAGEPPLGAELGIDG